MTRTQLAGIVALAVGLAAAASRIAVGPAPPPAPSMAVTERVPVIVELFTSEGCSSCPPADEVLARLVAEQPVDGARIIGLGQHVDYWNRLGWRDPFSSAAFSDRQREYASRVFPSSGVYTPQMVVDGREELVGSNYRAALAAVTKARDRGRRLAVAMTADHDRAGGSIIVTTRVDATGAPPDAAAAVYLAIVEDGLVTKVGSGENGGRVLKHAAVVRSLDPAGSIASNLASWSGKTTLRFSPLWNGERSSIVAFVQERSSLRVLGGAVLPLASPQAG